MLSVVALVVVAIWINVKPQPEIKILERNSPQEEWEESLYEADEEEY